MAAIAGPIAPATISRTFRPAIVQSALKINQSAPNAGRIIRAAPGTVVIGGGGSAPPTTGQIWPRGTGLA